MKVFVKIIKDFKHEEHIMEFEELAHFLNIKFWIPSEFERLVKSENKDILFIRRGVPNNAIIKYKFIKKNK